MFVCQELLGEVKNDFKLAPSAGFSFMTQKANSSPLRVLFPGCLQNSGTIANHPTHDCKMSVPVVLTAVAAMLDLLHKLGRELL
jgi:hypothetical protein